MSPWLIVIPAKAGSHKLDGRDYTDRLRVWIPACAGMTALGGRRLRAFART
jgi:hypothetical protein